MWTHGATWPRPVRFLKDSIKKIIDLDHGAPWPRLWPRLNRLLKESLNEIVDLDPWGLVRFIKDSVKKIMDLDPWCSLAQTGSFPYGFH